MTNKHKRPTQCYRIMQYLKEFGSITQRQAFEDLGIMRLASRIVEIRKSGVSIKVETRSAKNRFNELTFYAVYSLEKSKEA